MRPLITVRSLFRCGIPQSQVQTTALPRISYRTMGKSRVSLHLSLRICKRRIKTVPRTTGLYWRWDEITCEKHSTEGLTYDTQVHGNYTELGSMLNWKSASPGLFNSIWYLQYYLCLKKKKIHHHVPPNHKIFTVETKDERSSSTFSLYLKTLASVYKCYFGDFLLYGYCNFSGSHSIFPHYGIPSYIPLLWF